MNALTRFLSTAETRPAVTAAKLPTPRRLTDQQRDELLQALARSDLVAQHREGEANALLETRMRLVAEIEQSGEKYEHQTLAKLRELNAAKTVREALETKLRAASTREADIHQTLRSQQSAHDSAVAGLSRQLETTCDPRLTAAHRHFEHETQVTRCYGPPFVYLFSGPERDEANARGEPRSGSYDPVIHRALGKRMAALRAAITTACELKLQALSHLQVTDALEILIAAIPAIPDGASKLVALPPDVEAPR